MNIIRLFNQTIEYIETTLDGDIDEEKIAQYSGYAYPMFSRLFSILTETTLSEYIRGRRLTEAAVELRDTKEKVIDIAMKYGYETSDSFGVAFKNFHGFTPTEVRKGQPYTIVSRLQLKLSVQGGKSMKIKIEKKPTFYVAGVEGKDITSAECPGMWGKLYAKFSHEEYAALGEGQSVGVCYDINEPNKLNYLAGYIVTDAEQAKAMGLDVLEVEETEYAVVELTGKVPENIHAGWKYVMEVFFPEHGYIHSGQPDFEYYYEGDMDSPNYKMELWVPIKKAE